MYMFIIWFILIVAVVLINRNNSIKEKSNASKYEFYSLYDHSNFIDPLRRK